jgi:predicted lysophospholipase L1 biosynthesis ABC-type transport system permease subunit
MEANVPAGSLSRSVAQNRSLLRSADGKGLLPLIPARLADAVIGLAAAGASLEGGFVAVLVSSYSAIGMRRGQLAQMVAAESMIIAVIGAVLGSALGLALGAALAEAFTRSQQATVSIPVTQIAAYIVATALAGVLAAIAPARRAARLNILEAIAAE